MQGNPITPESNQGAVRSGAMGSAHTTPRVVNAGVNVSALQVLAITDSVPLLELVAASALCLSAAVALALIARWPRQHKMLVGDSWEPIAASDVAVRTFTVIASIDLVAALLALALLLAPIERDGAFTCIAYAGTPRLHQPSSAFICLHLPASALICLHLPSSP